MAEPNCRAASAITEVNEFGSTWRRSTAQKVPPLPNAASTYSLRRTRTTSERASRAKRATETAPTAIATLRVPKPSSTMMLSDSSSEGTASMESTRRIRAASVQPPREPATRPIRVPSSKPTVTATKAPLSECTAP